jgi:hypothetical protein
MIGLHRPQHDSELEDLVLVITLDRPTEDRPEGYMSMTAHTNPRNSEQSPKMSEDAADGAITEATVQAIVRDLRSYIATGRKAFVNDVGRGDDADGRVL